MNKLAYIIPIAALCMGCSHKNVASGTSGSASSSDSASLATSQVVVGYNKTPAKSSPSKALPKATAFRMNGDYADNVAVSVGSDGRLTYFPDPSDISADSRPVDLGDGWWLNRQGIGKNSVFTTYTFEEYSRLKQVPSVKELKESIIPGSKVEKIVALPYRVGEASSHIQEIKQYLKNEN
ncbi:MAG: hypothetical protein K1W02_12670 [Muribaculaceae bacterium]